MKRKIDNLTNKQYQLAEIIEQFQIEYPSEKILISAATKVVHTSSDEAQSRGEHWAKSMRGILIVTHNGLYCRSSSNFEKLYTSKSGITSFDNFCIAVSNVKQATLIHTRQGLWDALILEINLQNNDAYQFGLMPNDAWKTSLPFPVASENAELKWSQYSIKARIKILLVLLVFLSG